jgi:hypothetical protein
LADSVLILRSSRTTLDDQSSNPFQHAARTAARGAPADRRRAEARRRFRLLLGFGAGVGVDLGAKRDFNDFG